MSSAVADLETGLQAMLQLKPPGVSGSKIQGLTTLCVANVRFESTLIQKLYTHFKNAPGSHKLGVLYVVDSVTRKWTEQAKSAGQPINSEAPDGTFADGVNRVKELLPAMMNIIIQSAPADQKDKIKKLVDIWEKGQTFPPHMLAQFKDQLNAPQARSTTPLGSPPSHIQANLRQPPAQPPAPPPAPVPEHRTTSIADILAELARKNTAPPPGTSQAQDGSFMSHAQNPSVSPSMPAMNQKASFPPVPPPVNAPTAAPYATHAGLAAPNYASNPANPYGGAPPPVVPAGGLDPAMQQVLLIKALADQGLSPEQITGIIAGLSTMGQAVPHLGGGLPQPVQYAPQNQNQNISNVPPHGWGPRPDESRDRNGVHDREAARSPAGRYRQRSRSRSPPRGWNARGSPPSHRRSEPSLEYERDRNSPGQNRPDGRGRGRGNEYRQRSPPPRRGHSPSPPQCGGERWIGHDSTVPRGSIKVLSRTLFVGGVTMSENELRKHFDEFGQVQTCITNKEKRHAFVKMLTRADAVRARDAMQKTQLRTRWGVGFGPREDCDYQTGVSVIPISKLTDADLKWFAKAEHGGSGGKPPESGMVVEEPDIEIGAGVSSKAISRRMQTDKGGNNGPKSSRERDEDEFGRARRPEREERQDNRRHDRQNSTDNGPPSMPAVPPFSGGFGFMANGMPVFPPNFAYNDQLPPPGRR